MPKRKISHVNTELHQTNKSANHQQINCPICTELVSLEEINNHLDFQCGTLQQSKTTIPNNETSNSITIDPERTVDANANEDSIIDLTQQSPLEPDSNSKGNTLLCNKKPSIECPQLNIHGTKPHQMVHCPICSQLIRETTINRHLDGCQKYSRPNNKCKAKFSSTNLKQWVHSKANDLLVANNNMDEQFKISGNNPGKLNEFVPSVMTSQTDSYRKDKNTISNASPSHETTTNKKKNAFELLRNGEKLKSPFAVRYWDAKLNTYINKHVSKSEIKQKNLPFELIPNAIPDDLATELLKMAMKEGKVNWKASRWNLFDKVSTSHRLSATYAFPNGYQSWTRDPEYTEKIYTSQLLVRVGDKIANLVQEAGKKRFNATNCEMIPKEESKFLDFDKYNATTWYPSFAFGNCYRDGSDSLGFHGDHLTTLGPRAIIASFTVGATRLFQWSKNESDSYVKGKGKPVFSCNLKHNSLLIMWGGFQENWKHAVPGCKNESIRVHPIAGLTRFNFTFRCDRKVFCDVIPTCHCNRCSALRPTIKTNTSKYYYKCNPANNTTKTCEFFKWADWNDSFYSKQFYLKEK